MSEDSHAIQVCEDGFHLMMNELVYHARTRHSDHCVLPQGRSNLAQQEELNLEFQPCQNRGSILCHCMTDHPEASKRYQRVSASTLKQKDRQMQSPLSYVSSVELVSF